MLYLSIHPFSADYLGADHGGSGLSRDTHLWQHVPALPVSTPAVRCNLSSMASVFPAASKQSPRRHSGSILACWPAHLNSFLSMWTSYAEVLRIFLREIQTTPWRKLITTMISFSRSLPRAHVCRFGQKCRSSGKSTASLLCSALSSPQWTATASASLQTSHQPVCQSPAPLSPKMLWGSASSP